MLWGTPTRCSANSKTSRRREATIEIKPNMKATLVLMMVLILSLGSNARAAERLENYTNKNVLGFTPHPDDDTFAVGGTMALLAKNKNPVVVVIYTNTE